jgi:hypothetical protein
VQGFREVKQGAYMYLALDSSLLLPVAFTIVCLLHAKSTPSHSLFLTRSLLRACGLRNFTLTKAQHSLTHSLTHPLVITYWPFARSLAATFQHLRHLHYQHSLRDSTSTPTGSILPTTCQTASAKTHIPSFGLRHHLLATR